MPQHHLRAQVVLKQNIDGLLHDRHQTRKALADWCFGKSESWISKIMREERRGIPLKHLDRIADFFGLVAYQLFQPGITRASERRRVQRRSGKEAARALALISAGGEHPMPVETSRSRD